MLGAESPVGQTPSSERVRLGNYTNFVPSTYRAVTVERQVLQERTECLANDPVAESEEETTTTSKQDEPKTLTLFCHV